MTAPLLAAAILLRGVNVNGITIKSAQLKAAMRGIDGVASAGTVLASGNVMVTSCLPSDQLKAAAESALRAAFGYDAWVVVIERSQLAELVRHCPYGPDEESMHTYVTVSNDPAALDEIESAARHLREQQSAHQRAGQPDTDITVTSLRRLRPDALAWQCPLNASTQAALAKLLAKPRYRPTTTTRNLRTLIRLLNIPTLLDPNPAA